MPPPENARTDPERAVRRGAVGVLLEHWWPLLGANLVWTGVALFLAAALIVSPAALLLAPILALPTAGVFRVAGRVVRESGSIAFGDALDAWRVDVARSLGIGVGFAVAWLILALNIAIGAALGSVLGWAIAIVSAWILLGAWLLFWTVWPLLTDPSGVARSLRQTVRLAGLLVLADPLRIGALGLALAVLLVASAITVVPVVVFAMAASALIASWVVLPAADRLANRLARSTDR